MNKYMSVILALVLVMAVGASLAGGTLAGFLDTEVSTENLLCAGTRNLEVNSDRIEVTHGMPCKYYSEEFALANAGDLDGTVFLHIPAEDGSYNGTITWQGLKCEEAGAVLGKVWNGTDYVTGSPVNGGIASSESELVAEEGGTVAQTIVDGLGVDAGCDSGNPTYIMSKHIDIQIWFDKNGDGDYDDPDESIYLGQPPVKLADIACQMIELGEIPAGTTVADKGGGWGSYFEYIIGSGTMSMPLVVGQNWNAGQVTVWDDGAYLYVKYDAAYSGWRMKDTHVYAGTSPPPTMAPGQFKKYPPSPLPHENLGCVTMDSYKIALPTAWTVGTNIYIAAHAVGCDNETGWAMGVSRKLKIMLHLQQVEDPGWKPDGIDYDRDNDIDEGDEQKRWWPTNVFQGDRCTFDMVFWFEY